jgi:hypothetical protein
MTTNRRGTSADSLTTPFRLAHGDGYHGNLRFPSRVTNPLSGDWQRHVLASSGYLELGMLDDAALALEEIEPEDKTRNRGSWSTYCSLHHGEEMGHGRSGCQSSRKG